MNTVTEILLPTLLWAALATLVVAAPGTVLAYLLARRSFPGKKLVSTLVSLPLVLPPTAVGYLLLKLLADAGPLGREALGFDPDILLTWRAVVLACAVMAFPLYVRTARVSFEAVDPRLEDLARTLGYRRATVWATVTLPLAARGLAAAGILAFTRALGEFGATVMIAGNIPAPWQQRPLPDLSWVQSADPLIVTHPTSVPRLITRDAPGNWSISRAMPLHSRLAPFVSGRPEHPLRFERTP